MQPAIDLKPLSSRNKSRGYWESPQNQRNYLDELACRLDLRHWEEWYGISSNKIKKYGGEGLLDRYNNSPIALVTHVYPHHPWQPWRFESVGQGFWKDEENALGFVNWLGLELGVKHWEDWYEVSFEKISQKGGYRLLSKYMGSPSSLIMSTYPQYPWQPWKFAAVPRGYWNLHEHRREFAEWVAEEMQFIQREEWHGVTKDQLGAKGAWGLLDLYGGSPAQLLADIYPDTTWQPWHFNHAPSSTLWKGDDQHMQYIAWLEAQLGISKRSDWYGVTSNIVRAQGGGALLDRCNSLIQMLIRNYPDEKWDTHKWSLAHGGKIQQLLLAHMRSLLPDNVEIETEVALPWSGFQYEQSECHMEFDLWIPSLNVGMEYQGIQHFWETALMHVQDGLVQQYMRDYAKKEACRKVGITLVTIPYWWNCKLDSLHAEIAQKHNLALAGRLGWPIPESHVEPIAAETEYFRMGEEYFEPSKGYNWNVGIDVTARLSSVKHNGVRIITDGCGNFFTKRGNTVQLPPPFAQLLTCGMRLNEEGGPSMASGLAMQKNWTAGWNTSFVYIFDAPDCLGDIEDRIKHAKARLPIHPSVRFVEHWKVHDVGDIVRWMAYPTSVEGLMLHASNAPYVQGRHPSVLKVKMKQFECGTVIGHHAFRSLLQVKLDTGRTLWVHSRVNSERMRGNFPRGSRVNIYYYERHTSGIPRNAALCKYQNHYGKPLQWG